MLSSIAAICHTQGVCDWRCSLTYHRIDLGSKGKNRIFRSVQRSTNILVHLQGKSVSSVQSSIHTATIKQAGGSGKQRTGIVWS